MYFDANIAAKMLHGVSSTVYVNQQMDFTIIFIISKVSPLKYVF